MLETGTDCSVACCLLPVACLLFVSFFLPASALSAPKSLGATAKQGLALARSGDCVGAVPVLERAEAEDHRPATAAALAGCHVALGEILLAHEIYAALASEKASPSWDKEDRAATASAAEKADDLDVRIPKLKLEILPADAEVEVRIGGRKSREPRGTLRVPADEKAEVVVSASGFKPVTLTVLLSEGERKPMRVQLVAESDEPEPEPKPTPPGSGPVALAPHWLGVRFRGLFVPTFVMNIVGEGGTTTYFPGVGLTYTARLGLVDIEPSLTFTSYSLGTTPFKPGGKPDTEWELVESDLWGVAATLDILYRVALDAKHGVELRIGGSVGVGWAFVGELYRWQSFPSDLQEGDPYGYQKCNGPNDPAGSFRYCNQLDKDAERYGQPDASWSDGGARPIVYPWLALPQIGFAFRPVDRVAIDLELGLTLNGFLTGTAVRFGL